MTTKNLLFATFILLTGCFSTSGRANKCLLIEPPKGQDRSCSFVAFDDIPEYACPKILYIQYDEERLSSSQVTI
jgi:hypothetical protein